MPQLVPEPDPPPSIKEISQEHGDDWGHEVVGDWREPTPEERDHIREGECPWDKGNLPRWEDRDG